MKQIQTAKKKKKTKHFLEISTSLLDNVAYYVIKIILFMKETFLQNFEGL